jgi:hypothetical protein
VRRSRETVKRSDLAGWAGYGYERSHPRRYWGLKLYLLAAPDGMPVAWGLATPKLGEREVAAALLGVASDQGLLRPGMVIAADKGLAGRACSRVPGQGQPGRGRGSAPAAELDRRGWQRPLSGRGRGRGAGSQPAVGDGDDDQSDAEPRALVACL